LIYYDQQTKREDKLCLLVIWFESTDVTYLVTVLCLGSGNCVVLSCFLKEYGPMVSYYLILLVYLTIGCLAVYQLITVIRKHYVTEFYEERRTLILASQDGLCSV